MPWDTIRKMLYPVIIQKPMGLLSRFFAGPFSSSALYKSGVKGVTLAETLISLALLGTVLIPILFLSSSYFLSQLSSLRESMDATHSASVFINRLLEETALTQRILVGTGTADGKSDADSVYFAYYDPVTQKAQRVGYKLSASGSGKKLERLEYINNAWISGSPYGHVRPAEVLLPSTVQFQYCIDATCSVPLTGLNVQKTIVLRLRNTAGPNGWSFTKGRQTLGLPQNMPIVLSTALPSGQVLLSETSRELYNINLASLTSGTPELNRLTLNPSGTLFTYVDMSGSAGAGILSTLSPTPVDYPGQGWLTTIDNSAVAVDNDGRAYFGSDATAARMYTWKDNILSTITPSGVDYPGQPIRIDSDGRIFFKGGTRLLSWKNNILSTLNPSALNHVGYNSLVVAPNDRVYFGNDEAGKSFHSWQANVLTTFGPVARFTGHKATLVNPVTNGVYFGNCQNATNQMSYWQPATPGVTTPILTSSECFGDWKMAVSNLGRLYFEDQSKLYTWEPTTGLTTITTTAINDVGGWWNMYAFVPGSEQVYVGSIANKLLSFTPPNSLTTITLTTYNVVGDAGGMGVFADGRVVFNGYNTSSGTYQGHMYSWKNGILSTITPSVIDEPGASSFAIDQSSGRVYFGQGDDVAANPRLFWTWDSTTNVLSTILPSAAPGPVGHDAIIIAPDGRVYFGPGYNVSSRLWTWKDNVLTTITPTNITGVGSSAMAVGLDGRLFFGSNQTADYIRTWMPGPASFGVTRFTSNGINTYQTAGFSRTGSHLYTASVQDAQGDLYMLDTVTQDIERFVYNVSTKNYTYLSSLPVDTWFANIKAIATDQASAGIAMLDGVARRIYIYADRQATSGAASQIDLTTLSPAPTTPSGLAISGRTGNYLILDSSIQNCCGANANVRLFVVDSSTNALKNVIPIKVNDTTFMSQDLSAEGNFKIHYNERQNLLYLSSPLVKKTFAVSLPEYL